MSRIRADQITNSSASGAPTATNGLVISGIATATSFSGSGASLSGVVATGVGTLTQLSVTGISTLGIVTSSNIFSTGVVTATTFVGNLTGNATGLSGTPNINVGSVTATTGTFSGNVSVGGTLTYEDVTNVDSVGLVTARTGVDIVAGGIDVKGLLQEKVKITAGKLSDNIHINLDNGMVHHFTTQETTTSTPNITNAAGINTSMAVGDAISVVIITTAAAGGYSAQLTIDGAAVTEKWNGGSAPSAGGSSGNDYYTYNIIKTGNATYTVLANVVNFA
tara:strand:- start:1155 stop:1988 length:834 start_codon:yes stop_codon:yes gene_type:complete